ncbi:MULTISPECIES: hypothetical protein [Comamonas]|uniref:hypothetical protein n=1 Tax=Comamonas TaxID=283 RepID=UPI00257F9394|nr:MULTISPECIES: hypothetical protein [Comamonas]
MFAPFADDALEPKLTVADMAALRELLGDAIQPHQAIAMLDLGEHRSRLLISEGEGGHPQPVFHHMDVGIDQLATRTFKQHMPTEAQLEHGIMLVEDAAMPMARLIPPSNVFVTRDPYLLEVGQQALGVRDVATAWKASGRLPMLSREAVEGQFDMLARQAAHPHLPLGDLPQSPRWAAALLFLREILHHWQLGAVRLLPGGLHQSPKG